MSVWVPANLSPTGFPTGPWCSEKDWVLIGRYAGNRFKVEGLEVRIINDDNIIATILDPKDISYVEGSRGKVLCSKKLSKKNLKIQKL